MEKVFIITSEIDINFSKLKKYDKILVSNPSLWHICDKKGLKSSLLSDQLSSSEILNCYEFADNIFKKNNFKENDIDFIEFFRVYYWEFFYEYKLLEIFFSKNKNNHFSINQNLKKIPNSHLEIIRPEYLFNFLINENYKKNFSINKTIIINKDIKSVLKKMIFFLKNIKKNKKDALNLPKRKIFDNLIIASDRDLDKLIKLLKKNNLEKKNNLIFGIHNDKQKIINFFENKNAKVEFFDLNLFIRLRSDFNSSKKFKVSDCLKNILKKYEIKINSYYFEKLSADFNRANKTINILKEFLTLNEVKDIHIIDFNGFLERSIEQLSKNIKLNLNLYPHGWLGNPEAYFFNNGKYYYTGKLEKNILTKQDRDLKFFEIKKQINEKLISKKINKILILSTRARNRFATNLDTNKFIEDWNLFLNTLKMNETCEIHFKFHPNHNYKDWLINFFLKNNFENYKIVEGEVSKVTSNYDLVLDFGLPGSATRETLMSGTPIMIYSGLYRFDRGTNYHLFNSEFTFNNIEVFCCKINNCIKNPKIYLDEIGMNNKKLSELIN